MYCSKEETKLLQHPQEQHQQQNPVAAGFFPSLQQRVQDELDLFHMDLMYSDQEAIQPENKNKNKQNVSTSIPSSQIMLRLKKRWLNFHFLCLLFTAVSACIYVSTLTLPWTQLACEIPTHQETYVNHIETFYTLTFDLQNAISSASSSITSTSASKICKKTCFNSGKIVFQLIVMALICNTLISLGYLLSWFINHKSYNWQLVLLGLSAVELMMAGSALPVWILQCHQCVSTSSSLITAFALNSQLEQEAELGFNKEEIRIRVQLLESFNRLLAILSCRLVFFMFTGLKLFFMNTKQSLVTNIKHTRQKFTTEDQNNPKMLQNNANKNIKSSDQVVPSNGNGETKRASSILSSFSRARDRGRLKSLSQIEIQSFTADDSRQSHDDSDDNASLES